ncbi:sulfatase-like hydrolase/transferase [Fulvivirga sp. M361]|uniref:sulfatase family protein n=1 Tax=Fulvivirga sp. M361 TaxID=2594266 RepID=UPI00117B8B20|nr:arylsulfatase [Fulvivirga sp. M361]TRX51286.1 sulfatase-like hydrolase/transferase [Fulvivirga sp. M361]
MKSTGIYKNYTTLLLFVTGILTLPLTDTFSQAKQTENLPNVIVILADDIGYGDLGSYGGLIPTPNIDQLANEGMRFTDAHSPAALCAPSRFSMLTGSYPYRSHKAGGAWNTNTPSIFSDLNNHTKVGHHITVAEVMQQAGYRTAFFGKSHLGGDIRDKNGEIIRQQDNIHLMDFSKGVHNSINEYGFDYSYSLPSGIQHAPFAFFENGIYTPFDPTRPADNRSTKMWANGRYEMGKNGISEIVEHPKETGIGDVDYNSSQTGIMLVNKAFNFIDNHLAKNRIEQQDRPFLLYFASQAIHVPHTPPKDFDGDPTELDDPVEDMTGGSTSDVVYELDVQVGKLLKKLKEEGLSENTIVIFTSDNGALWPKVCDYGVEGHDNNGPLTGYKASIYEGGHRVPFIVKWPGTVKPLSVSHEPILIHDWVATIYELTEQNMAEDQAMDCTSLMPLLTGRHKKDTPLHPFLLYQAGHSKDGAIREGSWVLTVDRNNKATELYNLDHDLQQEKNLIDDPVHQEMIKRLHEKFLEYNDHNDKTREPRTTRAYRVTP